MAHLTSRHDNKMSIAPPPRAGESLGGWYARVSQGYSLNLHEALPVLDLRELNTQTIPGAEIERMSRRLYELTDIEIGVWDGLIKPEAKLTNMWLRYQPGAEYCFPQMPNYYCIECFLEDLETMGNTHYRVEWASPFVLSCHKHRSPLINTRLRRGYSPVSKLEIEKFQSRLSYIGRLDIQQREQTHMFGNFISPMARRVSDLFSLDDNVATKALKALGRHNDLSTARSAAIAVLQILSFRSLETQTQCLGRTLFAERDCK